MKTAIIVQARMTSRRLPGKVLLPVAGRPMLAQQIRRLRACAAADEILIATTTNAADDPVADLARVEDVGCFRGDEQDVLSRYLGAARKAQADAIVRITADCPLIDPAITDGVIRELTAHPGECDYAANILERSYPRGLDTEAFWFDTLLRMDRLGRSPAAREHVTVVARSEYPALFLRRSCKDSADNSDLRWTVDAPEDLAVVRAIYEGLHLADRIAGYAEILGWARTHGELARSNQAIRTWDPHADAAYSR
jgi:spore coat polysaccharide biosynthesis protein SpsF